MKKLLKSLRFILYLSLIITLSLQLYIFSFVKYSTTDINQIKKADVIMVLGAQAFPDLKPSEYLRGRLEKALELYNAKKASKILVSGDHVTPNYDEVNTMRIWLEEKGVANEDILMDSLGLSTFESARRAKELFGCKDIIITTQSYHMPRAIYIAQNFGLKVQGYEDNANLVNRFFSNVLRESLANFKAVAQINDIYPNWPE